MKCHNCRTDNADGARFCGECGLALRLELTCPSCGHNNPGGVKFCHECGARLAPAQLEPDVSSSSGRISLATDSDVHWEATSGDTDANLQGGESANTYELGHALEIAVEEILKAQGYSTQRRVTLRGPKGTSEIDILARKGTREVIAVECKNYSSPVPVKEVRDFSEKLRDLNIKNGIFAARPDFQSGAREFGQKRGLELWDEEDLKEKHWQINIGRLGTRELGRLKFYLPLRVDHDQAISLDFANRDKVEIEGAKLTWKPFYKVSSTLRCIRTLPNRKRCSIEDSGYYIVDGLSGTIAQDNQGLKNIVSRILGRTDEQSYEMKETDALVCELEQEPDRDLDLRHSQLYQTMIYRPTITQERATRIVVNAIVADYTKTVTYQSKEDETDLFAPEKEFRVVPSFSDIRTTSVQLIYAPKWEIEFISKEYRYTRRITGNSGTIVYDTITNCNRHWSLRRGRKRNTAVCDVCGEALCKEHIWKCPTCGSWRCEAHSGICVSCQERYCPEHLPDRCAECHNTVCDLCSTPCAICEEVHCGRHMTRCSKCGRVVCVSCTRKEGGLLSVRRKVYCVDCQAE